MDDLSRKADHRILALDATSKLQSALSFEDKWKGLVENSFFELIEDGYRRGSTYGFHPAQPSSSAKCG